MSLRVVTAGVAGSGKVADNLVCDALNQHFAFGPEDADGYFARSLEFDVHLAFPVGPERFTQGIRAVWQWAVRTEVPFCAITDGGDFDAATAIQDTLIDGDDWQISKTPELAVLDLLKRAPNPLLLVLTENGVYSESLRVLAAKALSAGIPVYDLARGLLEQSWEDIGAEPTPEPAEPEPAPAEPPVAEWAETFARIIAETYTLITDLQHVARGIDVLTPKLAEAERMLRELQAPPAAPLPPAAAPALTLVPPQGSNAPTEPSSPPQDDTNVRMRTEVFDEETGQWRPAGRGRPRAGARTRRVPR